MASENVLVLLSVVFKKFGLIANEFLSVICQFLNVGIINLSLASYIFMSKYLYCTRFALSLPSTKTDGRL